MRQFAFFALVLVLILTITSGETYAASCWSDPALVAAVGDTEGSLTIDPSGNRELVYDEWDDVNEKVRVKYYNSGSPGPPITVVEYTMCTTWPCPQGQVEDLEGITSARDATGKLHVAYGIEWGADDPDETFYMYKDSVWHTPPTPVTAIVDETPDSLTIDPSGNWELVYDEWDDVNEKVRVKYYNSGSPSPPVTVVEYTMCTTWPCPQGQVEDLEGITSARDATGKLHVAYGIESGADYTDETFYMYKDSVWHTPPTPVTAIGDASPGSLTIDPSGNWEVVYDAWDDVDEKVWIKYYNSSSPSPVTVVEYEECWDGPSCPPGSIADLEGITSARDSTGKLHLVYSFERAVDWVGETYYLYTDDTTLGADFTADVLSGPVPLTVNFTDQSCGTITSWQWNFGDGATSNEQNPSHTYSKQGSFTVSLTVNGPGGSDTETKPDYITVEMMGMPGIPLLLLDD